MSASPSTTPITEQRAGASTASISARETGEIQAANASGKVPVVFVHGLWLLPSSWANWAELFKQAGYASLTPDWPDDPATVEEARANPGVLARKTLSRSPVTPPRSSRRWTRSRR